MKKTFFENIGIVDLEKIHSCMIKWILDKETECINHAGKINFLNNLLKTNIETIDYVVTEFDNIDVLIKTNKNVIIIENKLKSSQHSTQLEKYRDLIFNNKEFQNHKPIFIYLTLLGEPAEKSDWINISYEQIYNNLILAKINLESKDGYILNDYIQTLSNLLSVVNDFIENPANYSNVFSDGSKTKSQKAEMYKDNVIKKYVATNQLETALQKLYLRKVANLLALEKTIEGFYITETHGNAAMGITIKINFNNTNLNLAFDYQKGTFKTFCTHEDYRNSDPSMIPDNIKRLFDLVKGNPNYGYVKVNKGKSKAQYSITKKMDQDISTLSVQQFAEIFKRELCLSKELIENEIIGKI